MAELLSLLLKEQLISEHTMQSVELFCKRWELTPFHALIETNIFEEGVLADHLASLLKLERVYYLAGAELGAPARESLSYELAVAWECLPHRVSQNGDLELVVADPTQQDCLNYFVRQFARKEEGFHFGVGTRSEILRAIAEYYPLRDQLPFMERGAK